jgi:hypothetical protein
MSEFRISEVQYQKFRRKFLPYSIPVAALFVCGMMLMDKLSFTGIVTAWPIFHVLFFLLLVLFVRFLIRRTLRTFRRSIINHSIVISSESVMEKKYNAPFRTINCPEIEEIIKTKKGSFLVRGQGKRNIIHISRWMDKIEQIEQELQALRPITTNTKFARYFFYRPLLIALAFLAFILCFAWSNNKTAEAIRDILAAAFLVGLLYKIQTSKKATPKEKALSWLILFFIAGILMAAYFNFYPLYR